MNPSQMLEQFAHFPLAHLPTPLEPLNRLRQELGGPKLFIKRDDCTGLAMGGNKTRKLEFLIGEALANNITTIVTEGGVQSNHVRQSAAAAARAGLDCVLVLDDTVGWPDPAYHSSGNRFLDSLLGADVRFCESGEVRQQRIDATLAELQQQGQKACFIPTGGSNAVGGLGYAKCALELIDQAASSSLSIDHVVLASGSGGTQGGFVAGLHAVGSGIRCLGVDIDKDIPYVKQNVERVAGGTCELLKTGLQGLEDRIDMLDGYAAPGYGRPNPDTIQAIKLLARLEGIILDPVYSGKAMAALIDQIRNGRYREEENVVFIHTGGAPALFTYMSEF